MTEDSPSRGSNRFQPAAEAFLRALVRLIVALAIGLAVAGVVYLLTVVYYQQAVRPARENAARMDRLETSQAISQEERAGQLRQFEERLSKLESRMALDAEALAELTGGAQSLDEAVAQQGAAVAELDAALAEQGAALEELSDLEAELKRLESAATYNSTQVGGLVLTLRAGSPTVLELQRDLQLLRAMQYLNQARLQMARSDFGDAEMSVYSARQALEALYELPGGDAGDLVAGWIRRLDVIRGELPEYPATASQDLEIAWSSMAEGFTPPVEMGEAFEETPTGTPTPYGTPTGTPTPVL